MSEKQNGRKNGQSKEKRSKSKWIEYVIILGMALILGKCVLGLQAEQKENFFERSKDQAIASCGQDSVCIQKVNQYFDACVKQNHTSYKTGKFKRKYKFDLEGFKNCVSEK